MDSRSHWERVNFTSLDLRRVSRSPTVRLSYDLISSWLIPGSYLTVGRTETTVERNATSGPIRTAATRDRRRRVFTVLLPRELDHCHSATSTAQEGINCGGDANLVNGQPEGYVLAPMFPVTRPDAI